MVNILMIFIQINIKIEVNLFDNCVKMVKLSTMLSINPKSLSVT